jgi:hypothetical protein
LPYFSLLTVIKAKLQKRIENQGDVSLFVKVWKGMCHFVNLTIPDVHGCVFCPCRGGRGEMRDSREVHVGQNVMWRSFPAFFLSDKRRFPRMAFGTE